MQEKRIKETPLIRGFVSGKKNTVYELYEPQIHMHLGKQTSNCISFKEIRILPVRGVIHHSFATIHPYINTHLTHLMDCLVKCDELIVNMIGGSSHFDGYAPARQRPKQ